MSRLDILVWHCRGAGNATFKRNITNLVNTHKPVIVALLETKVSLDYLGFFFKKLGFLGSVHVDPMERVGGIWLLWDPNLVSGLIPRKCPTSPNHSNRDSLWEELVNKATGLNSPRLLAGDMNDITSASESQTSSNDVRTSQNRKFRDRIDSCSLMDMGASGPKFKWSNGREGTALVQERLDRALYNADWRSLFLMGERNTRFFHFSTIIRRKSKVSFLKNDNNEWVDNDEDISNLVQIYYVDLFRDRGDSAIQHNCAALIEDSKALLSQTGTMISHIPRLANQSAHSLSRIGLEQEERLVVTYDIPEATRPLIREGILGAGSLCD
ncbi:hypothetical protein RHMOL_Rhmol11G0164500 [Rhododendron molle]|uniref:Uncharacterized protein n=1 Tax=Rhododendron molle TaxID=49168 RepID=A0ACC0LSX1_RHOML|nr:hypothetical protein RHMOL_Rhmol11G0164500 [Rhododendron molle]